MTAEDITPAPRDIDAARALLHEGIEHCAEGRWAKGDVAVRAAFDAIVAAYREKAAAAVRDAATIALLNERLREIESKPWDKLSAAMADRLAPIWSRDIEQRVADAERRGREAERADVVAKLRKHADNHHPATVLGNMLRTVASAIEAGEHVGAAKEQER